MEFSERRELSKDALARTERGAKILIEPKISLSAPYPISDAHFWILLLVVPVAATIKLLPELAEEELKTLWLCPFNLWPCV